MSTTSLHVRFIATSLFATTAIVSAASATPASVVDAKFAAVNRHSIPEIVAQYSDDAELIASDFCASRHGKRDVERTYTRILAAVPDVHVDVLDAIESGDRVAVRFLLTGHVGESAIALPIMNFFTVHDGLIVRDEGRFDNAGRACTP